jgi:NAD(P)-dependent dehydrogenase (short-subunit alcohol dehydrogenase family)
MTQFAGKTAFVTGAANGIGRATALAFAREEANLVLADINETGNEETARLIRDSGGQAITVSCDVRKEDDVRAAVTRAVDEFGRLDIAFNNAGRETRLGPVDTLSLDDFSGVVDVNVKSAFLCMKYEIPHMLENGGGVIVNTSSGAGVIGIKNQAAYSAAKHAVIGLTRSAALDYADRGVRINAVCPGIIATDMMERVSGGTPEGRAEMLAEEPIGRFGQPEEIASAVLWLCSASAGFAIGHALVMDGGHTIH